MPSKNLGRVSIVPKGTWNTNTVYNRLDAVVYDGSSWLAKKQNTGQLPAAGSDAWQLLAERGADGRQGIDGEPGRGLNISGTVEDALSLPVSAENGEVWNVGTNPPYDLYLYNNGIWTNMGPLQGTEGPQGPAGPAGVDGADGAPGPAGADGVSCTHEWNGTVLSITSASGTSSADLRGPAGADGATGPQGPAGADGSDASVTAENIKTALGYTPGKMVYNLLDNSDFTNPVNQRGYTSYGKAGYTIDRWNISANVSSLAVNDGYITATAKPSVNGYFRQYLESKLLFGKTVTFAVEIKDGDLLIASGQYPSSNPTSETTVALKTSSEINIYISARPNQAALQISINNGSTANLEWAALYEGEYTAETLPEYQPKGYGAELAECMRYYQKIDYPTSGAICTQMCYTTNNSFGVLHFATPMRIAPTCSYTGTPRLYTADGQILYPTDINFSNNGVSSVRIFAAGEYTAGVFGMLQAKNTMSFTFSSDL